MMPSCRPIAAVDPRDVGAAQEENA